MNGKPDTIVWYDASRGQVVGSAAGPAGRHQLLEAPLPSKKVRLQIPPGGQIGFSIRGGQEFGTGVFVSGTVPKSAAAVAGLKAGQVILAINGVRFEGLSHVQAAQFIRQHQTDLVITVKETGFVPLYKEVPTGKAANAQQHPISNGGSDSESGSICQHRSCHSSMENIDLPELKNEHGDIYENIGTAISDIDAQLAALQPLTVGQDPITDIDNIDGDLAVNAEMSSAAAAHVYTDQTFSTAASKRLARRQISSLRIRRSASRRANSRGGIGDGGDFVSGSLQLPSPTDLRRSRSPNDKGLNVTFGEASFLSYNGGDSPGVASATAAAAASAAAPTTRPVLTEEAAAASPLYENLPPRPPPTAPRRHGTASDYSSTTQPAATQSQQSLLPATGALSRFSAEEQRRILAAMDEYRFGGSRNDSSSASNNNNGNRRGDVESLARQLLACVAGRPERVLLLSEVRAHLLPEADSADVAHFDALVGQVELAGYRQLAAATDFDKKAAASASTAPANAPPTSIVPPVSSAAPAPTTPSSPAPAANTAAATTPTFHVSPASHAGQSASASAEEPTAAFPLERPRRSAALKDTRQLLPRRTLLQTVTDAHGHYYLLQTNGHSQQQQPPGVPPRVRGILSRFEGLRQQEQQEQLEQPLFSGVSAKHVQHDTQQQQQPRQLGQQQKPAAVSAGPPTLQLPEKYFPQKLTNQPPSPPPSPPPRNLRQKATKQAPWGQAQHQPGPSPVPQAAIGPVSIMKKRSLLGNRSRDQSEA